MPADTVDFSEEFDRLELIEIDKHRNSTPAGQTLDEGWLKRAMAGSVANCLQLRDAEHAVKWPEDRLVFIRESAI